MFAKLWGKEDDQVLLMMVVTKEGESELRLFGEMPDTGIVYSTFKFPASEEGHQRAKELFARATEADVRKEIDETRNQMLSKEVLG